MADICSVRLSTICYICSFYCRELIDEGVEAAQRLKGKRLYGAIYRHECTSSTKKRLELQYYCKTNKIAIWLPDDQDLG